MTFHISFNRRKERLGLKQAIHHQLIRGLAIVGVGQTLSCISMLSSGSDQFDINILHAIGFSLIFVIPILMLPTWIKAVIGVAIGIASHFLLVAANGPDYQMEDAGAIGIVGWISLMAISIAWGELFFKTKDRIGLWPSEAAGVLALFSGLVASTWIPISLTAGTLSYSLITTGTVSVVFLAVYYLSERLHVKPGFLCHWGNNPLVIYVFHYLLLTVFALLFAEVTVPVFVVTLSVFLAAIHGLVLFMKKRNLVFKI